MKFAKKAFVVSLLLLSIVLVPVFASANTDIVGTVKYAGQIVSGGSSVSALFVTQTSSSTVYSWVMPTSGASSMMAIALTAMSNNKEVTATMDDNGNLICLYVNNS